MTQISHESLLKMGRYRGLSLGGVEPETVAGLYRFMLRLRRCEEALLEEYHPADEMRCPVHFCIGQEAVSSALSLLLTPQDYLFSHHRSHGYFLAKGSPMSALFAELYGRETGANGGKAGSQDISLSAVKFYSGAILSGATAIAVGAALGCQLKGKSDIAVAGFGEGATDEGVFWEAVNYAVLRRLPLVLVCENNKYATYSPQLKRHPADSISQRVSAFGMKTYSLFGNDAPAVYQVLNEAIERARAGEGPAFVEAYTYRWNSHVGPEDDNYVGYRPQAEVEFWKTNCPIALLEEKMLESGQLTPEMKAAAIAEIDAEIAEAFQFAKSSPFPVETNWTQWNYATTTPVADRLLSEIALGAFNQNQADAIPGPY